MQSDPEPRFDGRRPENPARWSEVVRMLGDARLDRCRDITVRAGWLFAPALDVYGAKDAKVELFILLPRLHTLHRLGSD